MKTFALLVPVVFCACGGAVVPDAGQASDAGSVEQLCVDTINTYRATLSLPPYTRWTDEESCADGQAASDSSSMKAHGAFGVCTESAQDECPNWPGPAEAMTKNCLAMMWAEGPGTDFATHGHYLNMSSTTYTKVSCGYHQTSSGGWWATQDFH
jgi:hypothetical protein